MSLVTDIDFLIHRLRISQLSVEDRMAGRMIRFDNDLVESNDYIKTTSTSYPEMRYCSSPDIIPGLPDAPLLAYRQYSSQAFSTNSSPRIRPIVPNTNVPEKKHTAIVGNSSLRPPVSTESIATSDKNASKRPQPGSPPLKSESSGRVKQNTLDFKEVEPIVSSTSNSSTMSSPTASFMNSAMLPTSNFSPEATTELSSTSDLTSTDEYFVRDNVRQYHHTHQRMLSTIPESVHRLSNQFLVISDGEDDDIELDYDEVKKVTKIASCQEKHVLSRPALERHGSDSMSGNARPGVLPRKFSQANLASSPLNMIPGVVYPKSRMRSLSSSSLSLSSPFTPLKGSGLSTEAVVQPKTHSPPDVPNPKPAKSLLTEMIAAKKPVMDNPFLTEFAGVTGQGELAPLALKLYLPHSSEPTVPLSVLVRREATVESVIGFALYTYYDQHKSPSLTPEQSRTSHWTMRIVEDDGSIDEDFPALERSRQIEKFAFDQFALCEVSPAQAKANELAQTKAQASRETSSLAPARQQLSGRKPPIALPVADSPLVHNSKTATPLTLDNNISLASSDNGPLQMIKIQLLNQIGVLHTTTLNVAATTSLNAMKAAVCRKWNLPPENYDLTSSQARHALDRNATLEGLLGITELSLVPHSHVDPQLLHSQTSMSHEELLGPLTIANLTFIYRHYTVYRRMPMFVNKQERMLAIDGYYLHILPPSVRGGSAGVSGGGGFGNSIGAYSSTKTSSYHIGSMELCRQGRKIKRRFKLVFLRSHDTKTYDFEATTQEESDEICSNLNLLLSTYRGEKLSLIPLPSN